MEREHRDLIGDVGVARLEYELVQIKAILRGLADQMIRTVSGPSDTQDEGGTVSVQVPQPLRVTVDNAVRIHHSELEPISVRLQNTPLQVAVDGAVRIHHSELEPILVRLQNVPPRHLGAWLTAPVEEPTFIAYYDRVVPAGGKHLATLWNGTGNARVRIWRIVLYDFQEVAVTGTTIFGELRRITAHSGGTPIVPVALDTDYALPAGIVAATGATVTTDALIARWVTSSEEVDTTATAFQALLGVFGTVVYEHRPPQTPLTLRKNQGITLMQSTDTAAGSISAMIVFSVVG